MSNAQIKLSPKYKDFLRYNKAVVEVLEGTTASGKTTTGMIKFIFKVAKSDEKLHVISGQNLGVVEKNIIGCDLGLLDIFGDAINYYPNGKGGVNLPHLLYHCPDGEDKVIYVIGYDNELKWKYALGGQYGCVYIDEINTANMNYVRQIAMRCNYLMATLNPDDPDRPIYKEFINRCRPIEKYKDDAPQLLLDELNEEPMENWVWWYFSFEHNAGLTEEKKERIKSTHAPGTADYRHYILGLRGKSEGVIFDNFNKKKHLINYKTSLMFNDTKKGLDGEYFTRFTAGLDTSYSKNSEDTVAMSFLGITNKKRLIMLDEKVLNNKLEKKPFAPSDIAEMFVEFLEKNRNTYGLAMDTFIDNADQATIMELQKYKKQTGVIYNFIPAYKALKIIDRIQLQRGWFATEDMLVVDTCKTYIQELQTYSWSDRTTKVEPEDGNDHVINSVQYAWIPFRQYIGFADGRFKRSYPGKP